MIKVSVIVPIYNAARYLKECMDSILNQTLREIEIICVNDGSTDSSLDILKKYAEQDHRIRMIDKANSGYGHTMNVGIEAAVGEYIGIVEPDDFIRPDMYRRLYEIAKKQDVDMIKADFYRFKKSRNKKVHDCSRQKRIYEYCPLTRHKEYYNHILNPKKHTEILTFTMSTWTGIYKRTFLIQKNIRHNETPGASFQDNGFWFQTFCHAKRVYFLDEAFYMYRMDNPDSSIHSREKVYAICEEFDDIYQFLEHNPKLKKCFLAIYTWKKFHNYQFTLIRIDALYRKEFLKRYSQEFCQAQEKGELDRKYFTRSDWHSLHKIMKEPEKYEQQFYRTGAVRYKVNYYLQQYGVRKTLLKIAGAVWEGARRHGQSIGHYSGL